VAREFPTPWLVGIHRYTAGTVNAHNEPTKTWTPPKDQPGEMVRVIGWGPLGPSYEPIQDRSVMKLELYTPPTLRDENGSPVIDPGPYDVIDLPSGDGNVTQWEVQGWPRDYTHGFHGWRAGKIVDLQRVVG
jgi:hypothetical protein